MSSNACFEVIYLTAINFVTSALYASFPIFKTNKLNYTYFEVSIPVKFEIIRFILSGLRSENIKKKKQGMCL